MKSLLTLLLVAFSQCAFGAGETASGDPWDLVSADSAAIAVPKDWRRFDGMQPTMPIYRQGDGIGVPSVDETGAPVQIGLTVEKFPPEADDTDAIAREITKGAALNPELKMVGQGKFEALVLSDRRKATLVTTEFLKGTQRRSYYMKLVTKGDSGEVWVATGYIVAGRDSELPNPKSALAVWLRAHVVSLMVTKRELDRNALEAAYATWLEKQDPAPGDLVPPTHDITGKWSGAWQEDSQMSTEAFTMELVLTGATVKGTAVFMDAAKTRTAVSGEATGSKIRLVMSPEQPGVPETTWTGTVEDGSITGRWYLRVRGASATGSWSAQAKSSAEAVSPGGRRRQ
jgi:hypothetical protein